MSKLGQGVLLDPSTGRPERVRVEPIKVKVPRRYERFSHDQIQQAVDEGLARIEDGVLVPVFSGGSRQYWEEAIAWATADGTAVANTVSETILFPNVTIPASFLQDGRTIKLTAAGRHSTTATPTLIFTLRWGGVAGTLITKSGAITTGSAVAAAPWGIEILLTTRSNGSTGTVFAMGEAKLWDDAAGSTGSATNAPGIGAITQGGAATPAVATLDLTADTALALTATWSSASASNTITGHLYIIEALN